MRTIIRFAALLLMFYGVWMAWNTYQFTQTAEEASATIEDLAESDYFFGEKALVRFVDGKRSRRSAVIPFVLTEEPLVEKQTVSVLYDPLNPSNVKLNDPLSIWFLPGAAILLGLLVRAFIRRKRRVRRIQTRQAEPAHEIRSSTNYQYLPSNETAADHAREQISNPTVRRMR